MSTRHRLVAALAVLGALEVGLVAAGEAREQPEPRRPVVTTRKIAPGLTYTKVVQRGIPRRTFILKMDPAEAVTLDVTITEAALPARRALSEVVRQHGALAAINGDYSGNGDPFHPLAQDGDLLQTSRQLGTLFALTSDETQVIFERPELSVTLTDRVTGRPFDIARWNDGPPEPGEFVGYSPLGGTLELPPSYACSVRLLPEGASRLSPQDGVDRDYFVDVSTCGEDPLTRSGGIVVSAAPATDEATELLAMQSGTPMRLNWTFGWPGVLDAVGGAPMLIEDGRIVGECYQCGSQPRTAVGVTASGKILMVVVDGRQPRWSIGPTVAEFAQILLDLGAVDALNLDGGGSSEMVVEGEVVNRPSDGRERLISNAILVLPGPDPGETPP